MIKERTIFVGYDPRQREACGVAVKSILHKLTTPYPLEETTIRLLELDVLRGKGLYTRPTSRKDGVMWDDISDAPMSTEFAISRFLVPHLVPRGLALFVDGDILARSNLSRLFDLWDGSPVMVVKHKHGPGKWRAGAETIAETKMDGQLQTSYPCKNWSSVMLFDCDHPSNRGLTLEVINSETGRDLHCFSWLMMDEIGELPSEWNHLVGIDEPRRDAEIVHFTLGLPDVPGYEHSEHAEEWRSYL